MGASDLVSQLGGGAPECKYVYIFIIPLPFRFRVQGTLAPPFSPFLSDKTGHSFIFLYIIISFTPAILRLSPTISSIGWGQPFFQLGGGPRRRLGANAFTLWTQAPPGAAPATFRLSVTDRRSRRHSHKKIGRAHV